MATVVDAAKKLPQSSNIKIGGETVKLFNDEAFKKVRVFRNVADDAISPVGKDYSGKNEFDFNPFPVQTSLIFGPADCGLGKHAGRM